MLHNIYFCTNKNDFCQYFLTIFGTREEKYNNTLLAEKHRWQQFHDIILENQLILGLFIEYSIT